VGDRKASLVDDATGEDDAAALGLARAGARLALSFGYGLGFDDLARVVRSLGDSHEWLFARLRAFVALDGSVFVGGPEHGGRDAERRDHGQHDGEGERSHRR
jgi:hypothetical protein